MTPGDADIITSGFSRQFFDAESRFTHLGTGSFGGKAQGLAFFERLVREELSADDRSGFDVSIPTLTVLRAGLYESFLAQNRIRREDLPGSDDSIAQTFLRGDLPVEILGDLRSLINEVRTPLAIRSSSALEDSMEEPYAGIYATKMIPNNDPDPRVRFQRLTEAIKLVYASSMFSAARNYRRSVGRKDEDEKMAVILQEVVGIRRGDRFYPDISGVARSSNFYAFPPARPEDGIAQLALGLGKTIVDGGQCWSYSPAHPKHPPPFGSPRDWLASTQKGYWAVRMVPPLSFDPAAEDEFLEHGDLAEAWYEGSLQPLCSTYDSASDRIRPGYGHDGPRIVTFANVLQAQQPPLNQLLRTIIRRCEEILGVPVEIEFAATLDPLRFGCLQVRPMHFVDEAVDVTPADLREPRPVVAAERVLGNGVNEEIRDIVYVDPSTFDKSATRTIAAEVAAWNRSLVEEGRPYLLIGFGRWGSSDPWLGIPVTWGDVAGARSVVEATLPGMNVELSQGSHFFHNITALRVTYFMVRHDDAPGIDWEWLTSLPAHRTTTWLRHVRLAEPLKIAVDGKHRRGYIRKPAS